MNYITLINDFWKADTVYSFSSNETRLYFFLLHTSNSLGWQNPFRLSYRQIALGANLTVKTIQSARNRLKQADLIDFKEGKKGSASTITNKATYAIGYVKITHQKDDQDTYQNDNQSTDQTTDQSRDINKPENKTKQNNKEKESNDSLKKNIEEREKDFKEELFKFCKSQGGKHDDSMIEAFFNYWSEYNVNTKNPKMKFEKENTFQISKRLATWKNLSKSTNNSNSNGTNKNDYFYGVED